MPIKVLDPEVASRIAAGEVVERPASVVKELVENSLDAGAAQISVEVTGGGVSLIRVVDNGAGIAPEEVGLAFHRHATSKIDSIEDLAAITTLGFRGEALASIAAVAQVEIITGTADSPVGSYLSLDGSTVTSRGKQGRSPGTTVTVKNLFHKMPARLKFLKSLSAENSRIAHVVSQYALAFPEVKFALFTDGRVSIRTPGSGRLIDSVAQIYGLEIARNMLEIASGDSETYVVPLTPRVTGLVGLPAVSRSSRDYLSFFVNRRWISSRLLAWAIEEAYHGLLMTGRHPVAVINIDLPPNEVDVNIHPSKAEVKFHQERTVLIAVQKAVRQVLVQMPVPQIEEAAPAYRVPLTPKPEEPARSVSLFPAPSPAIPTPAASLPVLRVLGQVRSSFIVAEGPDGVYLIDQHAAHERISFERIQAERSQQAVKVQGLLEPATLEITPQQEAVLKRLENLADFGFAIEPFGNRTYLVRTVPFLLHDKDWLAILRQLLDSLSDRNQGNWQERVAISLACHSAIRAGQVLTSDEMRELVRQLEHTALPRTCPHGRPTMLRLSFEQLQKEFGRT